ncbi:DRAP deaminase [Exophiala viscosa]|uniref:DRAP deaminase n=1 Tax=Exophiala viscosa TaxID=2486360 RepID=UPI0021A13F15|nr:DRAP deaminase [Exophiala viscosa]
MDTASSHSTIARDDHKAFMEYALEQACLSPPAPTKFNVGAVLVNGDTGKILSTGYTSELLSELPSDGGTIHAEHCCIIKVAESHDIPEQKVGDVLPTNTVLYTTMEPCNERLSGSRSCVDRLLELKDSIRVVYFGISEPGILVLSDDGRKRLEDAGIEVRQMDSMQEQILAVTTGGRQLWHQ